MTDPPRPNRQRAEGYAPPPRLVRHLGGYWTVHPVNNGEQGRYATLEAAQAADVAYEEANPNLFSEERRRQLAEDRLRRWEAMQEGRELLFRLQNWRGGGGGGGPPPPPPPAAVSGASMSVVDRVFSEYYETAETGMWGAKRRAKRDGDVVKGFLARLEECFDAVRGGLGSMAQKGLDALYHDLAWMKAFNSNASVVRRFDSLLKFYNNKENQAALSQQLSTVDFDKMLGLSKLVVPIYYTGLESGKLAKTPLDAKGYALVKMISSAKGFDEHLTRDTENERLILTWKKGTRYFLAKEWAWAYLQMHKTPGA